MFTTKKSAVIVSLLSLTLLFGVTGCQSKASPTTKTDQSSSNASSDSASEQTLEDVKAKLEEGKVINTEFRIGDELTEQQVSQIDDPAGDSKDDYFDYKHFGIGIETKNQKDYITSLVSKDEKLMKITEADVIKVFGNPDKKATSEDGMDEGYYSFTYNKKYELYFVLNEKNQHVERYIISVKE